MHYACVEYLLLYGRIWSLYGVFPNVILLVAIIIRIRVLFFFFFSLWMYSSLEFGVEKKKINTLQKNLSVNESNTMTKASLGKEKPFQTVPVNSS